VGDYLVWVFGFRGFLFRAAVARLPSERREAGKG